MEQLKNIFHTLADVSRLKILQAIGDTEKAVGEIVKATDLSQPLVSHHLRVLKQNNVVATSRKGAFIFYSIKDPKTLFAIYLFIDIHIAEEAQTGACKHFCPEWLIKKYWHE